MAGGEPADLLAIQKFVNALTFTLHLQMEMMREYPLTLSVPRTMTQLAHRLLSDYPLPPAAQDLGRQALVALEATANLDASSGDFEEQLRIIDYCVEKLLALGSAPSAI